jgi:hypothetical protein
VQSLPLKEISPAVITFEHILLSQENYDNSLDYLHKFGYMTCGWSQNTVAVKQDVLAREVEISPGYFLSDPNIVNYKDGPLRHILMPDVNTIRALPAPESLNKVCCFHCDSVSPYILCSIIVVIMLQIL